MRSFIKTTIHLVGQCWFGQSKQANWNRYRSVWNTDLSTKATWTYRPLYSVPSLESKWLLMYICLCMVDFTQQSTCHIVSKIRLKVENSICMKPVDMLVWMWSIWSFLVNFSACELVFLPCRQWFWIQGGIAVVLFQPQKPHDYIVV